MINNYSVNEETKEATVSYEGNNYVVPPNYQDGILSAVPEEQCEEVVLGVIKGSEVLISNAVAEEEYDSKQYQRDRVKAYPSLEEQADMAYWDRQNGTTTLDDAILAVKTQFPKGE